jgi:hypothetical protein
MFGRHKPVVFYARGSRRQRSVPRWLVLLVLGIVLGGGGVVVVQERYLPPRLTPDESARLGAAYQQADGERSRLKSELADTAARLKTALQSRDELSAQLASARKTNADLRADLSSMVSTLPPDPRGGAVQVRAARFSVDGGRLQYDVVLSRARAGGKAMEGVAQFVVAGTNAQGMATAVPLAPVPVSVDSHETLHGDMALPQGFVARQATIEVMDRPDGKRLGMRVIYVE